MQGPKTSEVALMWTLVFLAATAGGGAAASFAAHKNMLAAGFCGMSIWGRTLLGASGAGFIALLVHASDPASDGTALSIEAGVSLALLLVGLVLYVAGQKSDGSDAWHRRLEEEARLRGDFDRDPE